MNSRTRRTCALAATIGLFVAAALAVDAPIDVRAQDSGVATTNACADNATGAYTDITWTLTGTATPATRSLGEGDVVLSNSSVAVKIPSTLLIAGYNFGRLITGTNTVPVTLTIARAATNVDTGGGARGTRVQVDTVTVPSSTVITDPDGIPGTGDERATPLAVNRVLPDMVVTPLGGDVEFSQAAPGTLPIFPVGAVANTAVSPLGSAHASVLVAPGLPPINYDCSPGTTNIDTGNGNGSSNNGDTDNDGDTGTKGDSDGKDDGDHDDRRATTGTTFTPAAAIQPFARARILAAALPPTCSSETVSVGAGQQTLIDLVDNCSDVNESQGGGSPFVYELGAPPAGTLAPATQLGTFVYTAPTTDPGQNVVIPFTVTDATGLASVAAAITVTVLANQCDAANQACDLGQVVVQEISGATITMDRVPGSVGMSPITLNGEPQVSTGTLQAITVTNARGTAAAWTVTAYATDIGAEGGPSFSPLPGVTVPLCSVDGAGPQAGAAADPPATEPDRLCIPGDNLGWSPTASIAHDQIAGDSAQVVAGPASAGDAAAWLAALLAAAGGGAPTDGLGGLLGSSTLCSAPVSHSGGVFTCGASLFLGVPASAGAGSYRGSIVLTLA